MATPRQPCSAKPAARCWPYFSAIRTRRFTCARSRGGRAGVGLGAAQRELRRLTDAGILFRQARGQQVYYQADRHCPVFGELQALFVKTAGVAEVLRAALRGLAERILVAFLYGSWARGAARPASDVDVLFVGDVTFAE